jgi:hypothetical protein
MRLHPRPCTEYGGDGGLHIFSVQRTSVGAQGVITHSASDPMPSNLGTFLLSGIGLIVGVLCLPIVIAMGGEWSGWLVGFLLWCANWGIGNATARWSVGLSPPATVGITGVSFIARAWLVALVLFVIALRYSTEVGLIAAGVFLACFTFDLAGRTALFAMAQRRQKEAEG